MSSEVKVVLFLIIVWLAGAIFGTRLFFSLLGPKFQLGVRAWFIAELAKMREQDEETITDSTVISHKEIAAGIACAIEDHRMELDFSEELRAFVRESLKDSPDTKTVGEFVKMLEANSKKPSVNKG